MQPSMNQTQPVQKLVSSVLSEDKQRISDTVTVEYTQAQLTLMLSQKQGQVAQLQNQLAGLNAIIASIQTKLALFSNDSTQESVPVEEVKP